MSGAPHDARLVADAVEGVIAALTRQRRPTGDPEPGALSTFQSLTWRRSPTTGLSVSGRSPTPRTTDATASRTVGDKSLELAERRPTGRRRG
jgi:hypothetical protein